MGIVKKTLKTIGKILTFLFRGAIPLYMTFCSLQTNDSEQIITCLNQWSTLALIMFLEPFLSPFIDIIPGGSIIFTIIILWVFSPYFSLSDFTYQYFYNPLLGKETTSKYYEEHLTAVKNKYQTILSSIKRAKETGTINQKDSPETKPMNENSDDSFEENILDF